MRPTLSGPENGYFRLSTRPLHVLVFLLPLILFYEIGSAFHVMGGTAGSGVEDTIRARRILTDFFRLFDVGGLYVPGILVAVVLLLWHVLVKDPWKIRPKVLGGMFAEAVLWTPPVLVLGQVLYRILSGTPGTHAPSAAGLLAAVATAQPNADLLERSLVSRAAIAVGAGLYEEMLFRMVAIALLHAILVDLIGIRERRGTALAVVLAAGAFAFYHDVNGPHGAIDWANAGFYIFAGLYFGVVYVLRGFGIVVAVHALYDLAVLVFLKKSGG